MNAPSATTLPCAAATRADILAGAPATDGAFFIVPRIVEGK